MRMLFHKALYCFVLLAAAATASNAKTASAAFIKSIMSKSSLFMKLHDALLWPNSHVANDDSKENPPLPPGSFGCPFLGSNVFYGNTQDGPETFYSQQSAQLNDPSLWKFYFFGNPVVTVTGVENIRKVFSQDFKTLSAPTSQRFFQDPFAGEMHSVVFEKDQELHQFTRDMIANRTNPMATQRHMPELQKRANKQMDKLLAKQEIVKVEDMFSEFVVDFVQSSIVGLNLQGDEKVKFIKSLRSWAASTEVLNIQQETVSSAFTKVTSGIGGISFIKSTIEEKIEFLKNNGPDGTLLSDMVFCKRLRHEAILHNAIVVNLAGYITTECVATLAIFLLGSHQDAWEKVVEEQKHVQQKYGDELTSEILDEGCPYLDAVVKETLRLGPTSIVSPRKTLETMVVDGVQIPKDWTVTAGIRLTHELDPVTYLEDKSHMDAMKGFVPDRWLRNETRPKEFIPFGLGKRHCLGSYLASTELATFIATLARRVDFDLLSSTEDVEWAPSTVIKKPLDGCRILARPLRVKKTDGNDFSGDAIKVPPRGTAKAKNGFKQVLSVGKGRIAKSLRSTTVLFAKGNNETAIEE